MTYIAKAEITFRYFTIFVTLLYVMLLLIIIFLLFHQFLTAIERRIRAFISLGLDAINIVMMLICRKVK